MPSQNIFTKTTPASFASSPRGSPSDPTIYLCNPNFGQAQQRWFFLTNAPPLPGPSSDPAAQHSARWSKEQQAQCRERVALKLARRGIDFAQHARTEQTVTPRDLAALFPATQGGGLGLLLARDWLRLSGHPIRYRVWPTCTAWAVARILEPGCRW